MITRAVQIHTLLLIMIIDLDFKIACNERLFKFGFYSILAASLGRSSNNENESSDHSIKT